MRQQITEESEVSKMKNSIIYTDPDQQMSFPFTTKTDDELQVNIFELYNKNANREFVSHARFIEADSLEEAEDIASNINPSYWKKQSVRAVEPEYIWKVFEKLHFSYNMCKSVLGIG